ncbi:MAG: hypothetical protein FJ354_01320 [Thaumarchaeota archaeon]|nr:hypothetical protein [Nitrososphaerota archaeon]
MPRYQLLLQLRLKWRSTVDDIWPREYQGVRYHSYNTEQNRDYVINPPSQLELMKKNWGGWGTVPVDCPAWSILSVDCMDREKRPYCIGSTESDSIKPICEDCAQGCYSVIGGYGLKD